MTRNSKVGAEQPTEEHDPLEPRSRPVQERSKATLNQILESAAELVDEVGVVGFTTNLLAKRSGVRIRTIYRYFPSKLGVLTGLMNYLNEDFEERLTRFSELGDRENDWRKLVAGWIDDVMNWTLERPGARLVMGGASNAPELLALQDRMDEEWAESMMDAMRARLGRFRQAALRHLHQLQPGARFADDACRHEPPGVLARNDRGNPAHAGPLPRTLSRLMGPLRRFVSLQHLA